MKRAFVPILFLALLLLLSVAFARQLGEKEYDNDAKVKDAEYHVDQWGGGPGWGGRPGWGGGPGWGRGGYGGGPGWGRGGYGGGPGWGHGGYGGGPGWGRGGYGGGPGWGGCRYRCYYGRCCSATEFAEFVQSQGVPQN